MASNAVTDLTEVSQLTSLLAGGSSLVALNFWADWCAPCGQMDAVFASLAAKYPSIKFARVEAEKLSEITEKYGVDAVPFFVVLKGSTVLDKVEGANAPELSKMIAKHASAAPTPVTPAPKEDLTARIKRLVNQAPVVLFMKGSPDHPKCGFSSKMVKILEDEGVRFASFDILEDEDVRQGLKTLYNWPTFPQLYHGGQLIGGLDIVRELAADGGLKELVDASSTWKPSTTNDVEAPKSAPPSTAAPPAAVGVETPEELEKRLRKLVNQSPVMLFMKGNPETPRCGFSSQMVQLLNRNGIKFGSFDILGDNSVREGLRKLFNWPTYPQLYHNGQLVGGLDITKELEAAGELEEIKASSGK